MSAADFFSGAPCSESRASKSRKPRAPRAALSLAPSFREVEEGRDAYVSPLKLRQLLKPAAAPREPGDESENEPPPKAPVRWWTFHGTPTTVELPGQRYAKSLAGFTDHGEDRARFLELLEEYASHGVPRPTGYACAFHKHFKSARVPWSVNAQLCKVLAGGWQDAIQPGIHRGAFYKYDIRSAYLWAGSLGMPDADTYQRSTRISDEPGVYRVKLAHSVKGAPYPFNQATECLATSEEVEVYGLPVVEVVSGVTWRRLIDPAPMLEAVRRVSTWKAAGRSYWGRWGQTVQVECHAGGKSWVLPNIAANVPWAALIIARVKMKVWEFSSRAVHVYIDSVITPEKFPTGESIGDWKLEKEYPAGVIVKGPGQYGDLRERKMERYAGAPKNSPLRELWAENNPELLAS